MEIAWKTSRTETGVTAMRCSCVDITSQSPNRISPFLSRLSLVYWNLSQVGRDTEVVKLTVAHLYLFKVTRVTHMELDRGQMLERQDS